MIKECVITLDLHEDDIPEDIRNAHALLTERGVYATYFIPTSLLQSARFRNVIKELDDGLSEIGTHSHRHDLSEINALSCAQEGTLDFLRHSARVYEDFFGRPPVVFRSPCWCRLADRSLDLLAELGYQVDSSSTPQRLGLFSSYPFENPWLLSPRRPHFVRPGLLEVPTSSFVVPFGRLSLAAFRKWGALAFAAAFMVEGLAFGHVINLQLHPQDFVPRGDQQRKVWSFKDLMPIDGQGFGMRHWILDENRRRMTDRVLAILDAFRTFQFKSVSFSAVYQRVAGNDLSLPND